MTSECCGCSCNVVIFDYLLDSYVALLWNCIQAHYRVELYNVVMYIIYGCWYLLLLVLDL